MFNLCVNTMCTTVNVQECMNVYVFFPLSFSSSFLHPTRFIFDEEGVDQKYWSHQKWEIQQIQNKNFFNE